MIGWIPFAFLLVMHLILVIPWVWLAVKYWNDDQKTGVTLLFQITLTVYVLSWLFGLVADFGSIGGGSGVAELTAGVIDSTMFLFMLCITIASSYRRE